MTRFIVLVSLFGWSACSSSPDPSPPRVIIEDADAGGRLTDASNTASCGPHNCDGCCSPDGRCNLGLDDERCGAGGAACQNCPEGQCVDGTCAAAGCGDGEAQEGEACDVGTVLPSCTDLGFRSGQVRCGTDCQFDTSMCDAMTCAVSQAAGGTCDFCSPDGTTVTRCGYCRGPSFDGTPREDVVEDCVGAESCHGWEDPETERQHVACLEAAPITCTESRCVEDVAQVCGSDGRRRDDDCSELPGGECIEFFSAVSNSINVLCVDDSSQACDPGTMVSYCDGDDRVRCGEWGYTYGTSCEFDDPGAQCLDNGSGATCQDPDRLCQAEGTSCRGAEIIECRPAGNTGFFVESVARDCAQFGAVCVDTAVGPDCRHPRSTSCDPSTYTMKCDGDYRVWCSAREEWEVYIDCTLDQHVCHEISGIGGRCAPPDYTPCEVGSDGTCAGATGTRCRSFESGDPRGWLETVDCPVLNPICVAGGPYVHCVAAPQTSCTPTPGGPNDYVGDAVAQSCNGRYIVACDPSTQSEVRHDCQADGGNWICKPPTDVCYGTPCWCAPP